MKELNNIKDNGFKAPKDYFQNLEDQLMDSIKLNDALQNMDDSGFKTPKGYFNTLEDVVLAKVDGNKPKIIPLFNKQTLVYISGVAAAVLIMFNVFFSKNEVSLDNLDAKLVENYFIDQGINTYEIASLLTDDINNINLDIEIFNETITDDSLESYLLENVDLEGFIEQ